MLSFLHILFSVVSLLVGAVVLSRPKGTRWHRRAGTVFCVAMVGLNGSALGIYHLTGRFNFFHITALLSLAMVLMGWAQVLWRRRLKHWLYRHYVYMCWAYVGLLAASLNEGFVRLAPLKALVAHGGNWVIPASDALLLGAAAVVIQRKKAAVLAAM